MHKQLIAQCLESLPLSFQEDELAYLALTSKPELHLRDKLAFALQNKLTDRLVCREWQRHDIAILPQGSDVAETIIELKVFYTFDGVVPNKIHRMRKALSLDVGKMRDNGANAKRMSLLFLIHPQTLIPKVLLEAVAYSSRINQVYSKDDYNGPDAVLRQAKHAVGAFWEEVGAAWLRNGDYTAGTYRGVEARIVYWLAEV